MREDRSIARVQGQVAAHTQRDTAVMVLAMSNYPRALFTELFSYASYNWRKNLDLWPIGLGRQSYNAA